MKRRDFIKKTSLASTMAFVPSFIHGFDGILNPVSTHKRLVVIQLSGGNDGLNTLVPFNDDLYYRSRPVIGLKKDSLIALDDDLALHQSLLPLKELYDQGYVSVLNNVGYPNPNRSHFRATDIWQTASHSNQYLKSGWVGRFLDAHGNESYDGIEIDESLSLALKGKKTHGIALKNAQMFYNLAKNPRMNLVGQFYQEAHLNEHNLGYLYKTMIQAQSSAKYIYETSKTYSGQKEYPNHAFGQQLKTTAEFINSGLETKVFYTSLDGFDTHVNQLNAQKRLLKNYADSMKVFVEDLIAHDTFKDTLILTFSEFGRRVKQNAGNGTDHGTSNVVFLMGGSLKSPGVYNSLASLEDLDENGDLKFEIDFRSIYASILKDWLGAEDRDILPGEFKKLNLV